MSEPWEQMPDEPFLWFQRFDRFRLMKPLHSIPKVYQQEYHVKPRKTTSVKVPGEWYAIAREWKWEERAAAWDAHCAKALEATIKAEEQEVMRAEFALKHKRIKELNRIVKKLIGYLKDESNIWLPDVKAIGTGPNARQVDLIRFNEALFSEIRAHFDDIAKEMGERVKKSDVSIKELPANVYIGVMPDEDGVDR